VPITLDDAPSFVFVFGRVTPTGVRSCKQRHLRVIGVNAFEVFGILEILKPDYSTVRNSEYVIVPSANSIADAAAA
jgi:hypothetical protein